MVQQSTKCLAMQLSSVDKSGEQNKSNIWTYSEYESTYCIYDSYACKTQKCIYIYDNFTKFMTQTSV